MSRGKPLADLVDPGDPSELFELLDELAQGSYGHVYRALYKPTNTMVALKIITLEEDETFDDLKIEIEVLKLCDHPNVTKCIGAWQKGEELFIAMEFCDGGSLDQYLEVFGAPLTEKVVQLICREMLKGLAYLHSIKIIHRDIKAANLLIHQKQLKLVDFGVSAIVEKEKKRLTFIGTPYWMAPEVIDNRTITVPYDYKCDIWSLGITLIELAEYNVPFSDYQPMMALRQIPRRDAPRLQKPEKWSKDFNDFIACCLQKNPDDRKTAQELLDHAFLKDCPPVEIFLELTAQWKAAKKKGPEVSAVSSSSEEDDESSDTGSDYDTVVLKEGIDPEASKKEKKLKKTDSDEKVMASLTSKEKAALTRREVVTKRGGTTTNRGKDSTFIAQLRARERLKQEMKELKKNQAAQLKERSKMESDFKNELIALDKKQKTRVQKQLTKFKRAESTLQKNQKTERDNLFKKNQNDVKNINKTFGTVLKSTVADTKSAQANMFKNYKDAQKKNLKTCKSFPKLAKSKSSRTVKSLSKEQMAALETKQNDLGNICQAVFEREKEEVEFVVSVHEQQQTHLVNLQFLQMKHLLAMHHFVQSQQLEEEVMLLDQALAIVDLKKIQDTQKNHLEKMQALEKIQQKQTQDLERTQSEDFMAREKEAKLRDFRKVQKHALKELEKKQKAESKEAKGISKKQARSAQLEERKVLEKKHFEEFKAYSAEVEKAQEIERSQLVEYHNEQIERMAELHARNLDKMNNLHKERIETTLELHNTALKQMIEQQHKLKMQLMNNHFHAELLLVEKQHEEQKNKQQTYWKDLEGKLAGDSTETGRMITRYKEIYDALLYKQNDETEKIKTKFVEALAIHDKIIPDTSRKEREVMRNLKAATADQQKKEVDELANVQLSQLTALNEQQRSEMADLFMKHKAEQDRLCDEHQALEAEQLGTFKAAFEEM